MVGGRRCRQPTRWSSERRDCWAVRSINEALSRILLLLLLGAPVVTTSRLLPRAPLERASPMEGNVNCWPHAVPRAWAAGCALAIGCWTCVVGAVRQFIHSVGPPSSLERPPSTATDRFGDGVPSREPRAEKWQRPVSMT